ncbi:helix-turn-helix domain-containing protein [Erwinia endophytica]|uniref:transcriptional regulator n=1 Tax=Erwinia endophytica TaxID=1563158 RepID=UPI001265FBFC|nr:helix-turn-helix domain-containing protein [Erwinia endophytica]KAB8312269.1 helix-turn-helix domain-containing protein [Erwinia endophytica]
MKKLKTNLAIEKACQSVGSQAALARCLGLSPPTVNQWVSGKRPIPAERCLDIEKATLGAVTCEELRPDVDWGYLRETARQQAAGAA